MLPSPPASPLVRSLGPTGLLGLAWTAAPAVCGTALLASLGPLSEWLLYHRPLGLVLYTVIFVLGAGLGFLGAIARRALSRITTGGLPRSLGTGGSGREDVSARAEDLLGGMGRPRDLD